MKAIHIFSKEDQEELLKEFCKINNYSYHMVCKIMFENLLGEEAAKNIKNNFLHFISGKFKINHGYIKFVDFVWKDSSTI